MYYQSMKQLKLFQNNFSQKDVNKILYWRKELRRAEREVFKCEKRHSYFKRRLFSASPINKDGSISLRKYKKKKFYLKCLGISYEILSLRYQLYCDARGHLNYLYTNINEQQKKILRLI